MEESCSCQDHGELTGVVGVVEPGLMVDIPCMIPPRETHDAISGLTPHSETPQNAKSAEFLILNQLIETDCTELNECFVSMLFFMVCLASKCLCV